MDRKGKAIDESNNNNKRARDEGDEDLRRRMRVAAYSGPGGTSAETRVRIPVRHIGGARTFGQMIRGAAAFVEGFDLPDIIPQPLLPELEVDIDVVDVELAFSRVPAPASPITPRTYQVPALPVSGDWFADLPLGATFRFSTDPDALPVPILSQSSQPFVAPFRPMSPQRYGDPPGTIYAYAGVNHFCVVIRSFDFSMILRFDLVA